MPPKQKRPAKRSAWKRFEDGVRRLFRSRDYTPSVPEPQYAHLNFTDWDGLERFSGILKSSSGSIGELGSTINRFLGCVKAFEEQARAKEEYKKIGADLNDLFQALAERFNGADSASMTLDSCANLARKIDEETILLEAGKPGEFSDNVDALLDVDELLLCYRRIRTSLALFAMNESAKMWKVDDDEVSNTRLGSLLHPPNAHYRAVDSKDVHRNGCMPNTRTDVLQDLRDWVQYGKFRKVYWLSGIAGTGKTTVAYSLCEWLENSGNPFASFFCSRDSQDCRDVKRIIPSLAYQLAQMSRPFRCAVSSALEQDPEMCNRPVDEQFKALIAAPLQSVGHTFGHDVVIVLDALDECEDRDGMSQVLDACFDESSDLPIRFLITSRRNPGILERMIASQPGQTRAQLRLHEIDRTVARNDTRTYFRARLERLGLSDDDIECLVQRSGGWFFYATSVADYLGQGDVAERSERLKWLVDISSHTEGTHNGDIDVGFATILEQVVDQTVRNDSRPTEVMLVLRTALSAQEPMSMDTIAGLLGLDFDRLVHTVLRPLLPVLQVHNANELAVGLCDSFSGYLLDPQRSDKFHCDVRRNHVLLAQSCFAVFDAASPAFNVCNLDSSYLLDREVPCIDERANESISGPMWYASRHWATHLKLAGPLEDHLSLLHGFLSRRLLLWMEVVNLKHYNSQAAELLNGVHAWITEVECPVTIQDIIQDSREFVVTFSSGVASQSTPHIYVSALPFWPAHRPVSTHFRAMLRCGVNARGTMLDRHVGSLQAETKEHVDQPLEGHTGAINSVAYSPDGAYIASGSDDETVRIWDAQTGQPVGQPLEGHTDWVRSVAYSPDGKYMASGSEDKTVRIWNTQTGQPIGQPLKGHTESVFLVAYSPDGAYIASGSADYTVRIWDAQTGQPVSQPLKGHIHPVLSVAYSPNGAYIASGSVDKTIRIWNAQTGQLVGHPLKGHTEAVYSVVYSPDGAYIASGSWDNTVRIWDTQAGRSVGQSLKGHTHSVWSVAYSPDGAYIASGSDDRTIRIWDAQTGQPVGQPLKGHTGEVSSVAFSPDGAYIASCSVDRTIRIWDSLARHGVQSFQFPSPPTRSHAQPSNRSFFPSALTRYIPRTSQKPALATKCPPVFTSEELLRRWVLDDQGWVVNARQERLIWVPDQLREFFLDPPERVRIPLGDRVMLNFRDAKLGTGWRDCIDSRRLYL